MVGSPDKRDQTRLLLSRAQRFYALAAIDHRRTGLTHRQWSRLRTLIEQIELFDTVAHIETLAAKCRCSRSTLKRVAELGRRAGVLRCVRQRDEVGRQGPSRWDVKWDILSVWAGPLPGADPECQTSGPQPARQRSKELNPREPLASDFGPLAPAGDYLLGLNNQSLPPASPEPAAQRGAGEQLAATRSQQWRRLEEVLFSLGVDRAAEAVRIASEQGCIPDQVAQIIAYWQEHGGGTAHAAWSPAGLCWRIQHCRPQLPADRGWPRPRDAHGQHERRLAAERQQAARIEAQRRERIACEERNRKFLAEHPDYDVREHIRQTLDEMEARRHADAR